MNEKKNIVTRVKSAFRNKKIEKSILFSILFQVENRKFTKQNQKLKIVQFRIRLDR